MDASWADAVAANSLLDLQQVDKQTVEIQAECDTHTREARRIGIDTYIVRGDRVGHGQHCALGHGVSKAVCESNLCGRKQWLVGQWQAETMLCE